MVISSTDNFKIKEIKKLHNKKYRDILGLFIVEGEHLVDEAFKNGYLKEVLLVEESNINIDINKTYISKKVMKSISLLESPSNVIGICNKINEDKKLGNNILILDNIQDPGNLGTIIRSSTAFNVSSIIISEDTVDIYNEKVIRSSQGMIFNINIIRTNLIEKIKELKEEGYYIYGTDVVEGIELKSIEKKDKSVIIIGNEGQGINEETKKLCNEFIYINMSNKCESLNASVAASIILYLFNKD
ncbi:MAG: RNA methyltransferase [Tenericutes bacterium]|nr:RNA methyltransferase [Bacilli bacterium]MDD3995627.1 RNA methyltransferase [Bacilli bacterium]MDD4624311.1 RNA methyltransferase [Bacilli bacterium]NLV90701.1 RNA methyltransferase [Mycoplasmatota bacterium]